MQFLANLPFDIDLLPKPVYVVGGAVRDGLLGRVRAELDLDLVIATDAVAVARQLAGEYQAGFVLLDAERQIARVVFPGMTVDIAQQDGADIRQDLARRDYTLNAIAYDLQAQQSVDPFNGAQDIQQRTIRMVSKENLIDDPLRLLRAYRQGAQLNFTIESATREAIRELAPLLTSVAAERVLAELRYLLQTPASSHWLMAMVADGLLVGWLELPVSADVEDRLRRFDRSMELLKQSYSALDRELGLTLRNTISIDRRSLGKFTLLLSPNLELATAQMLRLKLSLAEIQVVDTLITYLPPLLANELSLREQYFWFQSVGNNFSLLIAIALTDGMELASLKYLIDRYLDPDSQVAHPTPLMSGHELMQALSLPPSPTIGKLLTEIQVARIAENVTTTADAIEFANNFLKLNKIP
jgi:tRNA nucleotidyltransferase (CCA-adding enzyme)